MNKERYFIWKNMDALQDLIDSLNNNTSEDSPESSEDNNTEGEGENG